MLKSKKIIDAPFEIGVKILHGIIIDLGQHHLKGFNFKIKSLVVSFTNLIQYLLTKKSNLFISKFN
jgi:hypothetical protein